VAVQLVDDRRQPIGPATGLSWTSSNDSVARFVDGHVQGIRVGRARLAGRTQSDSMVRVDVFVAAQLLVSAQRGGRSDLYGMSADSVPRFDRLTSDSIAELEPTFSPDLTRIAYVAAPPERPTNLELYVANADGSEPRRLTSDSATVGSPVFVRPAGERIVFQSSKGGRPQLYEVALDGSGRRQLTTGDNPNTAPDVSPDGAKLVFVSRRQVPGSPRSYDIWEMNRDSTGERRLTTSSQNEDSPQYSADGRSVYFLRDEGGSPRTQRVYRQSLTDTTDAQPISPVGLFVRAFSVKPGGGLLVLTRLENVRGVGDLLRIVLFDPATGAAVTVQLGAGDQLLAPIFRPATPQPR
jgi:Tol biopolymer transport system component